MQTHAFQRMRTAALAARSTTNMHVRTAAPMRATLMRTVARSLQPSLCRTAHTSAPLSAAAAAVTAAATAAPLPTAPATSSASVGARVPLDWSVGHRAHGFRVEERTPVADFNLTVYRLVHEQSGALAYHIARADTDNAFSVAFRTPVTSSNGVAHILEHTALCGSQRFPVRDPFFLLVRRSLKTFMNAMTAQDYTLYPFSTCNAKDYQNLLEVYLDAAFFPLLNLLDFKQEGHRLETAAAAAAATAPTTEPAAAAAAAAAPASAAPNGSGLQIKGVVYNEMKGAMSDTSQLFLQKLQENLFPTNSNHWNSGGDPSVIPTLTHEQLRAFHTQNYNIDNAVFMSYGDMEPPLQTINERVIQPVLAQRQAQSDPLAPRPAPAKYAPERRLTDPITVRATCSPDPLIPDPNKQTKVCVSYLCKPLEGAAAGEVSEEGEVESFALNMLSSLLLDGPTAPLYQALIDPNIGSGYAPGTGYDNSTQEATFGLGLQGIAESDVERVLELIDTTLHRVAQEGFVAERVEAIIHQLEISLKHVRSNFGIGLVMRMTPYWAHGGDPVSPLRVNAHIAALRARLAQGPYFQQLVRKHLLNNSHRVTLVMSPDAEFARRETEEEEARLATQAQQLSEQQRAEIDEQARKLVELQNSKQDTKACNLPSLSAGDINRAAEIIHLDTLDIDVEAGRVVVKDNSAARAAAATAATVAPVASPSSLPRLVSLSQPTNGVGYVRGLVSAKRVPLSLRPYLPLYTSFLTEMGAGSMDYRQLSHALDMTTGGVSAELNVFAHLDDLHSHEEFVLFRSLALERNIPAMLQLFHTVLHQANFDDTDRLQQLLLQTASACSSSLQDSGSSYATSDASQHLFTSAAVNEIYGGIKYIKFINALVQSLTVAQPEEAKAILSDVAEKLNAIARILMQSGLERTFIVGDDASLASLQQQLPSFLAPQPAAAAAAGAKARVLTSSSSSSPTSTVEFPFQLASSPQQTFYALPLQVNNVSLVVPTVPYTHGDAPKLDVMAKILSSVYVHREVREKGGAYGGSVSHSSDGVLAFSSYRDPNSVRTLEAYHAAPRWLASGDNFGAADIEEALLSIFSGIDAPKPPAAKGMGQFLFGISNEQRQQYRDRLLAVRKDDVLEVCERYLSGARLAQAHVSIVGDETAVPSEIRNSDKWKVQPLDLAEGALAEGEEFFDEEGEGEDADEDADEQQQQGQRGHASRNMVGGAAGVGVALASVSQAQDGEAAEEAHAAEAQQPGQQQAQQSFSSAPRNIFAQQQQQQQFADAVAAAGLRAMPQAGASPRAAYVGAGAGAGAGAGFDGRSSSFGGGFLPDLGKLQPLAPALNFAAASVVGYTAGVTTRFCTRVGFFLAGVSGLCLYTLQRQGVIEFRWERVRSFTSRLISDNRRQVEAAIGSHPNIVAQLQQHVETLLTTTHGLGFSAGFLLAFK